MRRTEPRRRVSTAVVMLQMPAAASAWPRRDLSLAISSGIAFEVMPLSIELSTLATAPICKAIRVTNLQGAKGKLIGD